MRLALAVLCTLAGALAPIGGADQGGALPARRAGSASAAWSALEDPSPERAARDEEAGRRAVREALDWLAARQAEGPDGGVPTSGARRGAPVAVTALAALAYMAGGSTPDRGPHGAALRRAIEYLLERTETDASAAHPGYISDANDDLSRMHGHGLATLAMAEAYAISPRSALGRRLARALELAVAAIERSQGTEGGWYYFPERGLQHEGSVTITLVQALRAARNAGVRVDRRVIERAVQYVERLQDEEGAFRYALGREETSIALTAAGISTLNAAGVYRGREVLSGYDWLLRGLEARRSDDLGASGGDFPCYERLYLAQALFQHPDERLFERWFAAERRHLLATRAVDGSWNHPVYGPAYATAVNALVLALPDGLLPIFQR